MHKAFAYRTSVSALFSSLTLGCLPAIATISKVSSRSQGTAPRLLPHCRPTPLHGSCNMTCHILTGQNLLCSTTVPSRAVVRPTRQDSGLVGKWLRPITGSGANIAPTLSRSASLFALHHPRTSHSPFSHTGASYPANLDQPLCSSYPCLSYSNPSVVSLLTEAASWVRASSIPA